MKLHLENIQTKVGKLADHSIELEDGNFNITAIFESPTTMATVVDVDSKKRVKNQTPLYNTLVVTGSEPFIVFSVHYDRRYIRRKFRNYR
jgi:hypothetical protein